MNSIKILLIGSIGLLMIFLSSNRIAAINEDQIFITIDQESILIDRDDFLNSTQIDILDNIFDNDLDTFDSSYILEDLEN